MNRLLVSLALVGAALSGAASARDLKTMHSENDLPRPAGVEIAGARPDQVTLYCTQISAGCKGLRDHLRKTGIDFVDKDPKTDPAAGAEFDALGGQGVPLVVFKQRLMHGYYPSSFDTLYAQYHAGTKAAPAAKSSPATVVPAPMAPTQGAALSGPVDLISPAAITAYLQAHPDAVLQLTSPDSRCAYCVSSYQGFEAAARVYGQRLKFARVEWTPWNQFPKEVEAVHSGGYAPTQLAFHAGRQVGEFNGSLMNRSREFDVFLKRTYALGEAYPASIVAIDELDADNLAAYLATHPRAVIQFTSPDPNCGFCGKGYVPFEAAAAGNRSRVSFARVQWLRWNQVPASLQAYKLNAVPVTLAFKDSQEVGRLAGAVDKARLATWVDQQLGAR